MTISLQPSAAAGGDLHSTPSQQHALFHYQSDSSLLMQHNILGLLVGGSMIYRHGGLFNAAVRDWDGLIVVQSRHDLLRFVSEPEKVAALLGIKPDPGHDAIADV